MPVCNLVSTLNFNYRREMKPLHDVNFDDVIFAPDVAQS